MKKFILGIVSTLGAIGVGKLVYEKGRKDQAKELYNDFSNIQKGMMFREDNEDKES